MGNCWSRREEIAKQDWKPDVPKASAVAPATDSPTTRSPTKIPPSPVKIPKKEKSQDHVDSATNEVRSLRLYGDPMCPLTMQILLALRHKELQYECSWLDKQWSVKEEWAARNGSELKLALLQHGKERISGSPDAILQYVEGTFPQRPLMPTGEIAGQVEEWSVYLRDTLGPLVSQLLYDGEPSIQEELKPELDVALAKVNNGLRRCSTNGLYFFGEQFTMADVMLIPTLALLDPLHEFRSIEVSQAYDSLLSYKKNMLSFPVYASAKVTPEAMNLYVAKKLEEREPPPLLILTLMQHRSILWHFDKLLQLVDELLKGVTNKTKQSPSKGAPLLRRLSKSYGRLVDLMQEHAQMEERVVFPALDHHDTGVTDEANSEHGRDLPIMNGIREEIKILLSLEAGTRDYNESLGNLSTRLRSLQANTEEHFKLEEKEFVPLLDSTRLDPAEVEAMVIHCLGVMEASHGHLLPYFLAGLNAQDMYQYMMVLNRSLTNVKPAMFSRLLHVIQNADAEFEDVRRTAQQRFASFSPFKELTQTGC